jgi:cephalosporin hydroxylase
MGYLLNAFDSLISSLFHVRFYAGLERTWDLSWMGVTCLKNPLDMWMYQELLHRNRPDVLVECGTNKGGSALFFAHMFDLIGRGRVISIDVRENPDKPRHPRIEYLVMSSTSLDCVRALTRRIQFSETVMAVLDSDHSAEHVRKELELYAPMVTKGQYLVVEDTNINGHPVKKSFGPGPMEALMDFLKTNRDFEIDRRQERLKITFSPSGWLKRVA